MIYYPLCVLMEAGIREIMIITTPHDQAAFKTLLQDGSQWGLSLTYAVQDAPRGIAEALIIAEAFLDGGPSVLQGLEAAMARTDGASVFGYRVNDPQRYGVAEFDETGKVLSIEEKPTKKFIWIRGNYMWNCSAAVRHGLIRVRINLSLKPRNSLMSCNRAKAFAFAAPKSWPTAKTGLPVTN